MAGDAPTDAGQRDKAGGEAPPETERERQQRERDEREDPDAGSGRARQEVPAGAWLNKLAVAALEFPFAHRLVELEDGWRMEAMGAGELHIQFTDGRVQRFSLGEGDHLSTSGDEMYLFFAMRAK